MKMQFIFQFHLSIVTSPIFGKTVVTEVLVVKLSEYVQCMETLLYVRKFFVIVVILCVLSEYDFGNFASNTANLC